MTRLLLVRHGRAAAEWGSVGPDADDPGLDDLGRDQAAARGELLRRIAGHLGPDPVVWSSPRRRAQETATPLAAALGARVEVEPRLDEVPSPADGDRRAWLDAALRGNWSDLGAEVSRWRDGLAAWARGPHRPEVVVAVTHFVAINALVSTAEGSDLVTTFLPDHASCTELAVGSDGNLRVVSRGGGASTVVR